MHTLIKTHATYPDILKEGRYFLDIETTGLCKQTDIIYCIGIMFKQSNQLVSYQWIIDTPEEEKLLLNTFITFTQSFESLLTYNGKQFEIPFLTVRLNYHQLPSSFIANSSHIDLKRFSIFKLIDSSPHLKRAYLERSLGFTRQLTIKGIELIRIYKLYTTSKGASYESLLLQHNLEELMSMYYCYEAYYIFTLVSYDKVSYYETTSTATHFKLSYPFEFVTSCTFSCMNISISWEKCSDLLSLSIIPHNISLKKSLTPAKDYVYIPSQNQIVHKSIAQFIPKLLKEKITKELCFLTKEGSYIQLPSSESLLNFSLWYNDKKDYFVDYEEFLTEDSFWQYIKRGLVRKI